MFVLIKVGKWKNQIKKASYRNPDGTVVIMGEGEPKTFWPAEYEIMSEKRPMPEAFDSGDQIYVPKPPEEGYMEPWPNPGWEEEIRTGKTSPENTVKMLEEEVAALRKEIDSIIREWEKDKERLERANRIIDALTGEKR